MKIPTRGKWVVLCDEHDALVNVDTKADTLATSALDFCDDCRDRHRERELSEFQRGYQQALADIFAQVQLRGAAAAEEWIRNNRVPAAKGIFDRALRDHT